MQRTIGRRALLAGSVAGLADETIEPIYVTNAADARAIFQSGRIDAVGLRDPFLAGAATGSRRSVAAVTSHLGLGATRSTTYAQPYSLDRSFAQLAGTAAGIADQLAELFGTGAAGARPAPHQLRRHHPARAAPRLSQRQRPPNTVGPNRSFCSRGCERQYWRGASTVAPSFAAACQGQRGS